ncbi:uncharacterized protein BO72DRAFT_452177 [Aspergillus fijiensis CBS 313.89]|uniref:Uncharacterized protein n=1 Tax=Aspergillus fijiensis CBS 313.89 TaxID=1448319 RepID=A0A8G1RGK9_9EURO|nr:uncharacterized protein BO72DRAFT_452177 [Aspergillus fijiensis CBS 313.89]RAK72950.1 hypothetical protein BO72DRAFT_452177 [Aspergillus fijiensis CBS 313.89]
MHAHTCAVNQVLNQPANPRVLLRIPASVIPAIAILGYSMDHGRIRAKGFIIKEAYGITVNATSWNKLDAYSFARAGQLPNCPQAKQYDSTRSARAYSRSCCQYLCRNS